jgi:hypothetical protein
MHRAAGHGCGRAPALPQPASAQPRAITVHLRGRPLASRCSRAPRVGDMGAFDTSAHVLSVTMGHSRLGRGGNGMAGRPVGSRWQPVFGRLSASGDKWPTLTAVGWHACQCDRAGSGVQARRLTVAAAANTRATQVRVREASNTRATRTKRHSPAHLCTGVKIVVSARLPGWMRSSWAD